MTSSSPGTPRAPWLVLDTALPIAVVGVVDGARVLGEHVLAETKKHAEGLVDAIDRALLVAGVGLDQIVGVGVGRGPGSFIGVRTGIATAKGLALGRGIPLVGLPTLVALAYSADLAVDEGARGLVVIDAKRGELYAQLLEIRVGAVRVVEPAQALSPADVERRTGLAFVVGAAPGSARISALGLALALRDVTAAGVVDELDALVPDYCRAPDAKLPAVDPSARRALSEGIT